MKKINNIVALLLAVVGFTACSSDRDSNPVYQDPTTFVLNTPVYVNNLYDLENSATLEFTCSQANYGYTAPAAYTMQIALTEDGFNTEGAYKELATVHHTAKMNIPAAEFAVALSSLSDKGEADYPYETAVYVRVKSVIPSAANTEKSTIYSNVVKLPRVLAYYALPPVEMPKAMHIIGDLVGWDWSKALAMVPVHSNPDLFWRVVYLPAGKEIKFNEAKEWDGGQFGMNATIKDLASAGITGTDNIKVTKGGWYLVVVKAVVAGSKLAYTVYFAEPNVYLFGKANGGKWEVDANNLFTVPADGDSDFVSQPFASAVTADDGGVRACVNLNIDDISGVDWWKSEFMVLSGKLEYRGTGGDQARVSATAGQKLYINFTKGTGKIE